MSTRQDDFESADALARKHTRAAIDTLAEIMDDPMSEPKDRIKAADSLLDRGHGKPLQAIITVPNKRAKAAALASLSDVELLALIEATPLPQPVVEQRALPSPEILDAEDDPLLG